MKVLIVANFMSLQPIVCIDLLWGRFINILDAKTFHFDKLDVDTPWLKLLEEFGFETLEVGTLLKIIKTRKSPLGQPTIITIITITTTLQLSLS